MNYIVQEHWPAFVDRSDPPRKQIIGSPEEALEIPWVKERGSQLTIRHDHPSISSGTSCVMNNGHVVANIYPEGKY